jgi:hypothetical protein
VTIYLNNKKSRNENKQTAAFDMQSSDTLTACVLEDQTMHFSLAVNTKICWLSNSYTSRFKTIILVITAFYRIRKCMALAVISMKENKAQVNGSDSES